MQLGSALKQVIRGHLCTVGYDDSLIRTDWSPHDVAHSRAPISVPLMAFWAKPFDQFRSAVAIVQKNGVSPRQVAEHTVSHVLQCEEDSAELWLLDATDIKREGPVPIEQLEGLFNTYRQQIDRSNVARTKIQLRQYALYEADPQGNAFGQWAVKPSIDVACSRLESLVAATKKHCGLTVPEQDWARWMFRIVALRVGLDAAWPVASGLGREDVSGFVDRAAHYPDKWGPTGESFRNHRMDITEKALSYLQHFDFSTVDPLFISKAVSVASLKTLRSGIDLFPTPKPFAWDMMASIPLTENVGVCDATAGTGTFLIAAGHAIWANASDRQTDLPDLRRVLRCADSSAFSTDFAHIGLDLAFGWKDAKWSVDNIDARQAVSDLPCDREWALVGNPPWAAEGPSRNKASQILSHYVEALTERASGWIAVILPRSVLSNRNSQDRKIRQQISTHFRLESAWDLPFNSIPGGRSQGVAIVLSRGDVQTTTVWKQIDKRGIVNTVGYSRYSVDSFFMSAHARFLRSKFADSPRIGDWFDGSVGVTLKARKCLQSPPVGGDVSFVHWVAQLQNLSSDWRCQLEEKGLPSSLGFDDAMSKNGWLEKNSKRPARFYRSMLDKLPHIVVPLPMYEGVGNFSCVVIERPMLFGDAFCILTSSNEVSSTFARGVAVVMSSLLGRLWLHLHAFAGRHLSKTELMKFPLPIKDQLESLGQLKGPIGDTPYEVFKHGECFAHELRVCSAYGLDECESTALLALSHLLGHQPSNPQSLRRSMEGVKADTAHLRRLQSLAEKDGDVRESSQLYMKALAEMQKDEYLVVEGDNSNYQLSIEKTTIGSTNG